MGPTPDLAPPAIAAQWPFDFLEGGASRSSGVGQSEGDPVSQPFPGTVISHNHLEHLADPAHPGFLGVQVKCE